ncbi:uncharacterized protein LOC117582563 [Drosophila guanche]|uniref:Blast:RISC-loading complex subunit tarbp2 n=1 Tax=Drosophila guanche TaxID=7266 RepID=A0A3B0K205_DROGU|nr:uncharacterized protein LOC117582563 [Drosophila guanche]SPP79636.1 blast:RISC-loading complex subunit tarbp2 [Drosophila guanche]
MEKKSAVSSLQEFCAKSKTPVPKYDYIDGEDGGYICKIILMEIEAYGNGRSKRDSKHLAAANMLKKLRTIPGLSEHMDTDGNGVDNGSDWYDELKNLNRDMVKELRDYCVRHESPLPFIEIVQQSGTPDAPEFVACCTVASIKRYGKSDKKKDARQRAAIEMLSVISADSNMFGNMQVVSTKPTDVSAAPADAINDIEAERRLLFTTYRELTESGNAEFTGRKLCDAHNYYKNFFPHLKKAAFDVINSEDYENEKDQLMDLLSALNITPDISTVPSTNNQVIVKVVLDVDFDQVFLEVEDKIYGHMIGYFKDMLV